MSCYLMRCSCSLCPFCATKNCPCYNEQVDKYWIYVENGKESCYIPLFSTNNKKELIPELEKIRNKKRWAKCYKAYYTKNSNNKYEIIYKDEIRIVITQSKYAWYTAIDLILDLNTNKYRYKHNNKIWNNKIIFGKKL